MKRQRWLCLFATVMLLCVLPITVRAETDTIVSKMVKQYMSREEKNIYDGARPCRGEANLLLVYLSYDGQKSPYTVSDAQAIMTGNFDRYDTGVYDQNVHDYFETVSYGKLNVNATVIEKHLGALPAHEDVYDIGINIE